MKKYRLGFIGGVFDMFHIGHLNLIIRAKEQCEKLIVGIVPDIVTIRNKGRKPLIPEMERVAIIAALRYVDEAVLLEDGQEVKRGSWERFRYDCCFSGDDWQDHPFWQEEQEWLRSVGSDLVYFDYTEGRTSTQLLEAVGLKERRGYARKLESLLGDLDQLPYLPELLRVEREKGIPIVLYGYGANGRNWLRINGKYHDVACIVDNAKSDQSMEHDSIPILTFAEFCHGIPSEYVLLVTPWQLCISGKEREAFIRECEQRGIHHIRFLPEDFRSVMRFRTEIEGNSPQPANKLVYICEYLADGLSQYSYYEFIRMTLTGEDYYGPSFEISQRSVADDLFGGVAVEMGKERKDLYEIPMSFIERHPEHLLFVRKYGEQADGLVLYALPPDGYMDN